jgi:hypothetical protein
VIIWKEFQKAIKIEGHKQAVWAVKFIGEDRLLTGMSSYLDSGEELISSFCGQDYRTPPTGLGKGHLEAYQDIYRAHRASQGVESTTWWKRFLELWKRRVSFPCLERLS